MPNPNNSASTNVISIHPSVSPPRESVPFDVQIVNIEDVIKRFGLPDVDADIANHLHSCGQRIDPVFFDKDIDE